VSPEKIEPPTRAFVGVGGNVGDVETTLAEAMWSLDSIPQTSIRAQSRLYRTPPWGNTDQPAFINGVVELQTRLTPRVLLDHLLDIEVRFGRDRTGVERWSARTLDLDLLLYGDRVIDEPGLHVPHPHLHERAFALVPLVEVAPDAVSPGRGRASDLVAAMVTGDIHPLG